MMAGGQFINGPPRSGKTRLLLATCLDWLSDPGRCSQVLILSANHVRQEQLKHRLLQQVAHPLDELPVYTYSGLVRNLLMTWWPLVEATLQQHYPEDNRWCGTVPQLVGIEEAEALLRHLSQQPHGSALLNGLDQSPRATLNQLLRRQRLRSENRIDRRLWRQRDERLAIPAAAEIQQLEARYEQASLQLRWLDGSRQLDVFHGLIQRDSWVKDWLAQRFQYLAVDDVEETTPGQHQFLQALQPTLQGLVMTGDTQGGSRQGYLNAWPQGWKKLWQAAKAHPAETMDFYQPSPPPIAEPIATLVANWQALAQGQPLSPLPATWVEAMPSAPCWLAMVDQVLARLDGWRSQGHSVSDLVWVLPQTDSLTLTPFLLGLEKRGIPVQILSGTVRPSSHPLVRCWCLLLQLVYARTWQMPLGSLEFRPIIAYALGWQQRAPRAIEPLIYWVGPRHQQAVWGQAEQGLPDWHPVETGLPAPCQQDYERLRHWVTAHADQPPETLWWAIYQDWIAPHLQASDDGQALQQITRSFERHLILGERLGLTPLEATRQWVIQVKTGVSADSPILPPQLDPNALVIGSPQKVIDYEIRRPHQWWIEIGSAEWHRTDEAPLYQARIHGNPEADPEWPDNPMIQASADPRRYDRALAVTRTLWWQSGQPITTFSSELDAQGEPATGVLPLVLATDEATEPATSGELIVPSLRADQAQVLAYQGGTLAISAVPGAGKTYTNVAFILDRIRQGTPPDRILVLTFMESAARTLQSRLKARLLSAGYRSQPQISTIHALAYRLLTQAPPPYGLAEGGTILDEVASDQLLRQVAGRTQPPVTAQAGDLTQWSRWLARLIPHAKARQLTAQQLKGQPHQTYQALGEAMALYQELLRQANALDFTDLIVRCVQALAASEPFRQEIQSRYDLMIEDEAQDSSQLMQQFLRLIGGDRPNLIRTGDTNQSITTTFSTADAGVFRQFIQQADARVEMVGSGRCAPEIIDLANHWLAQAPVENPHLAGAFLPVAMTPVPGQNPPLLAPLQALAYETEREEREALVAQIQQAKVQWPEATTAVLVRGRQAAEAVTAALQGAGLPVVCLSDTRQSSSVLRVLSAWLVALQEPHRSRSRVRLLEVLHEAGCYGLEAAGTDELAALREQVAAMPLFYLEEAEMPADGRLRQMIYDWRDWQRQADTPALPEVLIRMSERLFTAMADRSNAFLAALQAKNLLTRFPEEAHPGRETAYQTGLFGAAAEPLSPLARVSRAFEQALASRKSFKRFTDEAVGMAPGQGVTQVMTLHKAKGQEFDLVWMPWLTSRHHPAFPADRRLQEDEQLLIGLDQLADGVGVSVVGEQVAASRAAFQRAVLAEEARLIYVGLTRARQGLVLSTHGHGPTGFGRQAKQSPAFAFQFCHQYLEQVKFIVS